MQARDEAPLEHDSALAGGYADDHCISQTEFFVRGESFTIADWMISMKESPESVARTIISCIPAYLDSVMDKCFPAYHRGDGHGE